MRRFLPYVIISACAVNNSFAARGESTTAHAAGNEELARIRYEQRMRCDPATGQIPRNIRQKELAYARRLPARESAAAAFEKSGGASVQSTEWNARGPWNIGGRTRALGIDINDNYLLAAGVSGRGIWRSADYGKSWDTTDALAPIQGATCLAQDTRPGKTGTWYCGSGESEESQGRPALFLSGYAGRGIYKSTDEGETWDILSSTTTPDIIDVDQPFDYVYNIVTDSSNDSADILYAAVYGGIERSSDGGATWTMTLGNFGDSASMFADVAITSTGVVYAALSAWAAVAFESPLAPERGIYRSTDGIKWTNITPTGWRDSTLGISIGVAPSDHNVVYFLVTNAAFPEFMQNPYGSAGNSFWKYTYVSGDGAGSGGLWENRSANLPGMYSNLDPFYTQESYDMFVRVEPDNKNVVYIGGVSMYRSTDGLATSNNISELNGAQNLGNGKPNPSWLHSDEHTLVFDPVAPTTVIVGCDGGIYRADFSINSTPPWTPLNNGYLTTQFYSTAIDHGSPANTIIIGGMQDNGTSFSPAADVSIPWQSLLGGDGSYCAITDGRTKYFVSTQSGNLEEFSVSDGGVKNTSSVAYVIPINANNTLTDDTALFIAPFILDPGDQSKLFFASTSKIWRNNDLSQTEYFFGFLPVASDWDSLYNTTTYNDTISTLALSTIPAHRLYYGTVEGKVYRIDGATTGQPIVADISQNKGLPSGAYAACIAVDPQNADNAIAVFANYHVQSLFYTSDGGASWGPIGGNLEEYPDGSGNGPSCRWASILHVNGGIVYLVGTSVGLFSTSALNGASTVWYQEGASTIGNAIVDMMDVRQSDGFVAVATHGSGMFSGQITALDAVDEPAQAPAGIVLYQNAPNPAPGATRISYSLPASARATLRIYDALGREVQTLVDGAQSAGLHTMEFRPPAGLPAGVYHYRLRSGGFSAAKTMIVLQ